jgi:hypothetical protein
VTQHHVLFHAASPGGGGGARAGAGGGRRARAPPPPPPPRVPGTQHGTRRGAVSPQLQILTTLADLCSLPAPELWSTCSISYPCQHDKNISKSLLSFVILCFRFISSAVGPAFLLVCNNMGGEASHYTGFVHTACSP